MSFCIQVPKCLLLVKGKDILYEKVFALLADLATNEKFKHRKTQVSSLSPVTAHSMLIVPPLQVHRLCSGFR